MPRGRQSASTCACHRCRRRSDCDCASASDDRAVCRREGTVVKVRCIAWTTCLASLAAVALAGCGFPSGGGDGAASVTQNVIVGTVLYRERIALPPDAKVEVRLEDVSRADALADVIAKQTVETNGRQVPV